MPPRTPPIREHALAASHADDGVDEPVGQLGRMCDEGAAYRPERAGVALGEVAEDVLGDHAVHARLVRGGVHDQAAAEREPHQRDVVQFEVIEHGCDRTLPLRCHRHARFERGALPRAVERDHLEAVITQGQAEWKPLLDVAVETTEYDDPAGRRVRCEAVGGDQTLLVRNHMLGRVSDLVLLTRELDEALPQGPLPGVIGRHEELRHAEEVGGRQ